MVNLTLYFFSFVLTYMGFLLGNSTKEEHKEIKRYVLVLIDILKIVFFIIMFVLFFRHTIILVVLLVLFAGYIGFNFMKKKDLIRLNDILIFSFSFIFLSIHERGVYLIVILMMALIFENSFRKFKLKEEIYVVVLYMIIFAGYLFAGNLMFL